MLVLSDVGSAERERWGGACDSRHVRVDDAIFDSKDVVRILFSGCDVYLPRSSGMKQ